MVCGLALGRLRQLAARQPHADVAMAAVLFTVTLVTTVGGPASERAPLSLPEIIAAAVACGALIGRRYWPLPVLVVATAGAEAYLALFQGNEGTLILAVPLIAIYTVVEATGRRRALIIGILAVLALAGTHMLIKPSSWMGAENVALAALGGLAITAGEAARHRRAYLAEVEERARRAELDRVREARRMVIQERLRIARDLHDAVGHNLALITVQASAAAQLLDEHPEQARKALGHVREASRDALNELSDTIGLLRDQDQLLAPVDPAVGLSGLGELVASFRRSGLEVRDAVLGTVRPLPPSVDLTAYRIVQESLTNVAKHARVDVAWLQVGYLDDALRIVVEDHGHWHGSRSDTSVQGSRSTSPQIDIVGWPADADSRDGPVQAEDDVEALDEVGDLPVGGQPGHGLVGMRERVVALGGTLHAGPRHNGGFRVTVTLPLRVPPATESAR